MCYFAGYNGGDLGRVVNGCHGGDYSCTGAAGDRGYIKEILDSCIGVQACICAARDGGNISSITNGSCVGENSCYKAAYNGFIGYINHGCGGVQSCLRAARDGSIGRISYACNNIQACEGLADGDNGYASANQLQCVDFPF